MKDNKVFTLYIIIIIIVSREAMHDACGIKANLTDTTITTSCGHHFIIVVGVGRVVVDCIYVATVEITWKDEVF